MSRLATIKTQNKNSVPEFIRVNERQGLADT